jgi:ribosomal protein S18 acetylase RimI-like enzyme
MSVSAAANVGWSLLSGGLRREAQTEPRLSGGRQPSAADAPVTGAHPIIATLERIMAGPGCPHGSELARSAARRLLSHIQQLHLPARHLWSIVDPAGQVLGGALAIPSPGRAAQVLASRPATGEETIATASAVTAATAGLSPAEAAIAQAVLDEAETDSALGGRRGAFLAARFEELAVLDYLSRPLPRRGESPRPTLPAGVAITAWRRGEPTLLEVLEASYVGTLDCPRLCGLRRTEDILVGHLAAGRFVSGLWSLLWERQRPVGALLLSPSHSGGEIDLVYLGLSPEARGRGLGRLLLSHGLHQIAGRREGRIALAVDRANAPAVRLYERLGFVKACSRLAVIKPLSANGAPHGVGHPGGLHAARAGLSEAPSTAAPR